MGGRTRPASHPTRYTWAARVLFALAAVLLTSAGVSLATAQQPSPPQTAPAAPATPTPADEPARGEPVLRAPPPVPPPALPARAAERAAPSRPKHDRPKHDRPKHDRPKHDRPAADPEAIRIAALGIDQELIELGVIGTDLQVPDDYSDVGWWSGGPAPGEDGAAVMVGHVDSPTGPAVFYQLSGLQPGHRVTVRSADGSRAVFAVRKVRAYDRAGFPSTRVYRSHGAPALHLVTCGGSFDAAAGRYTSNVVAFADLVKRVPAPGRPDQKSRPDKQRQPDKQSRPDKQRQPETQREPDQQQTRLQRSPHGAGVQR